MVFVSGRVPAVFVCRCIRAVFVCRRVRAVFVCRCVRVVFVCRRVWAVCLQMRPGGVCLQTRPGGVCLQTRPGGVCLWMRPGGVSLRTGVYLWTCPDCSLSPVVSEREFVSRHLDSNVSGRCLSLDASGRCSSSVVPGRCLSMDSSAPDASGWCLCPDWSLYLDASEREIVFGCVRAVFVFGRLGSGCVRQVLAPDITWDLSLIIQACKDRKKTPRHQLQS